ncbi:MAG: hypothetical protein WBC96_02955 [Thermodesulfobacteriota bacterium]
MRHGFIIGLLCIVLLSSCDSEITGSVSSETITSEIVDGCAADIDIAHSDCPAIELANACDPFLCRVASGQNLEEEIELASDYTLPECERDCKAMDCSTIECRDSNTYSEINVTINQDGQMGVSGILNQDIVFTCQTRTSCGP